MTPTRARRPRILAIAAVSAVTVLGVLGTAAGANAGPLHADKKPKPPTLLTIIYAASGTSHVAKPNSTVALGPTSLTATLNNQTDAFTGSLPLPPAAADFKILGLLPVTATVSFIANGPVTGQLTQTGPVVTAAAKSSYYLQLSNVSLAGIPTNVGSTCVTAAPVEIDPATPTGQTFNPFSGGTLTATYTIGSFANCGLTTFLINQLVPGSGNTLSLTVSDGQLQLPPAS